MVASDAGSQQQPQSGAGVRGVVIPTGFQKDRFSALIQIVVEGSPLPGATWELEATVAPERSEARVISGRIVVDEPGIPAVLESQVTFRPGPYEMQLKAFETTGGQTGAGQLTGEWPDLDRRPVTVGPIAIVQPGQAAFMRDGDARDRGAIGRGKEEPVLTDLPTALVCLVCRDRVPKSALRVERELSGETFILTEPVEIDLGNERCVQVRDLVGPGTMTEGFFRYDVRVFDADRQVAAGSRIFSTAKQES
jgi:hypothetical protein